MECPSAPLAVPGRIMKGHIRMNDKRDYIKMTLAALAIIGGMLLFYTLTPIPVLHLGAS